MFSHIWDILKSILHFFNPFKTTHKSHSHNKHNTHESHQHHAHSSDDKHHHEPSTEQHSHQVKQDIDVNDTKHHQIAHLEDISKYMPMTCTTTETHQQPNQQQHHERKDNHQTVHAAISPQQHSSVEHHHSPLLNDPIESSEKLLQAKRYAESKLKEIESYEKKPSTSTTPKASTETHLNTSSIVSSEKEGLIQKLSIQSIPSDTLAGKR
jgi:hypothetical protein